MRRLFPWIEFFCIITFTLMGASSSTYAAERKMLVEVQTEFLSDVLRLQEMDIDIASERAAMPSTHIIVTDRQLEMLKENGWKVNVLIEDIIRRFDESVDIDGDLGEYHTYAEMVQEMQQVAALYPNITRLVDIGDSWEKVQGLADRDIWAMKISDNPDAEEAYEPDVLIVGNHHARELITVEIPLAIIRTLASRYAQDPRIRFLVDHREIWIVPMVNPDGHVYVEEVDPMWRKNRNTNGYGQPSYQGVDLNRNYSFMWGYDDYGSSPNPWSQVYRGTAPFSEPEVQALRDLAESHRFVICLSYHSYGDLFLFPWGYINADTEDHSVFEKLGQIYTGWNGYVYGNAKDGIIYNTNGDMDDWMYGEQVTKDMTLGVTLEVGGSFQPPSAQIPALISENLKPALWMVLFAVGDNTYP